MDIFNVLTMIGGLCLFLFGMNIMGQVIDILKEKMRTCHILRLQRGKCSIDVGFVWSDIFTNLERVSDHCSNIAGCVIDIADNNMNIHESLRKMRLDSNDFRVKFDEYAIKYSLTSETI